MKGRASFLARCNWAQFAAMGGGGGGDVNPGTQFFYYNDFLSLGIDAQGSDGFNGAISGAGASLGIQAGLASNPGVGVAATGTDAAGEAGAILCSSASAVNRAFIPSAAILTLDMVLRVVNLPDGTNTFIAVAGLADRLALGNQRAIARIFWNGSAARWGLETGDGVGTTQNNAATGPTANTFHHVRLLISSTQVAMEVDGVAIVAPSATNLPNSGATACWKITKSAGAASRQLHMDVLAMSQTLATPRWT